MIDLHTHILPRVDDGPESNDDALEMVRIAERDGIDRIVATPHVPPRPGATLTRDEILARVDTLNRLVIENGLPVQILAGSEIRFDPGIVDGLQNGSLMTVNGTVYVLLELPLFGDWPDYTRSVIFELQMAGFAPILAHVERYPWVQREPTRLYELVTAGVLMQINAGSIVGTQGHRTKATAEWLCHARMAHLIASDAHSPRSRSPRIAAAYNRVARLLDDDYVAWMKDASEAVVGGTPFLPPEPCVDHSQRWWTRLWRG